MSCDLKREWRSFRAGAGASDRRRLEHAPEPGRHAADIVRVTRGIGSHPFAAAPREADFKHRCSTEPKRGAQARAGLQVVEAEVVRLPTYLAELGEHAYP